jgi:trehalose 6-phosphate phosphatase
MSLLFSTGGLARLDEFAKPGLLCAFDFDGTLAPIVAHPDHAYLPPAVREQLLALMGCAPVAIITGRSVNDIASRLGFRPDFIVGNHGLEGVPGWEAHAARHEALCAGWRMHLEEALHQGRFDEGVFIEDKRFSLSVHYRKAAQPERAAAVLAEFFSGMTPPPRVVAGKSIYSLMPEDGGHKGSALTQLLQVTGAHGAIYVGDDVTDEDVFRMRRPDVLSVRVEQAEDSAAEFYLPHLEDIGLLLRELIARLCGAGAGNWIRAETARMN